MAHTQNIIKNPNQQQVRTASQSPSGTIPLSKSPAEGAKGKGGIQFTQTPIYS